MVSEGNETRSAERMKRADFGLAFGCVFFRSYQEFGDQSDSDWAG